MLGTISGSTAWIVVRRAPLPRWVLVGVPALLYAVAQQTLPSGALYGVVSAALIAFGAALGAFVRPGEPGAPAGPDDPPAARSGYATVAAFLLTSALSAAAAALGPRGPGPESATLAAAIVWGSTATALVAGARAGRTAAITRADISDAALLLALAIAVTQGFLFDARKALAAAMALHAGVQWWMSRRRPRFGPYAGIAALCIAGPLGVTIGDRELPAVLVELRARITGVHLPVGQEVTGYLCPPPTALSGPIACGNHLVALVGADTPIDALGGANAFVVRTSTAWPPSTRLALASLDLPVGSPITLLGGGRVRYADGTEGEVPLPPPNHDALEVRYTPEATVGDFVALCDERACGLWPPPPPVDGVWRPPLWTPLLRFATLLIAGGALVAKVVAAGPVRRWLVPAVGLVGIALGAVGIELFVFGSAVLLAGVGFGLASTAPIDRRGWLALGFAIALGVGGCLAVGSTFHEWIGALACAWGIGPVVVAGRRGLEGVRAELAVAAAAVLACTLASAYSHDPAEAVYWSRAFGWIAALCLVPAGLSALIARRWVVGAGATAAGVALGVGWQWQPPEVTRLSAIDADTPLPVVDGWVSGIAPPVCALNPSGDAVDLTTGATCTAPVVAALPAASPAEVILERPDIVQFVVRPTHGHAPFGVVVLVPGAPGDDPSGAVTLRGGETLGALLARCDTRCSWFRPGIASVPQ